METMSRASGLANQGETKAVADSVAEDIIPVAEADDLFCCVGVFIHWKRPTTRKSRTSTIAPPRKRSPGRWPASQRLPKWLPSLSSVADELAPGQSREFKPIACANA